MTGETILDRIIPHKREELERRRASVPIHELRARLMDVPPPRPFRDSVRRNGSIRLIAEVKKASPSKGVIRKEFEPAAIAEEYETAGADALSVLTDERFFQGHLSFLSAIRERGTLPILRKDFTLDAYHVVEARAAGADAILLIVSVLDASALRHLREYAAELGMTSIVEVHNERELDVALATGADLIGVNNRNLQSFETTLDVTFRLRSLVPDGCVLISESGIHSREHVLQLESVRVDAMLVGEALMRSDSITAKIAELRG